ncbi:hypothetical protein GCM10009112_15660 [Marinomonas arenicola]|uniref:hypothetical protein n=1 Tax=Marinomonas TaxID=28253 RepID=UPI0010569934|nr:hypothetical protein [Marinomonas sp. KMM3893]
MEKSEARKKLTELLSNDESRQKINSKVTKLIAQSQFKETVYLSDCLPEAAAHYLSIMAYPAPNEHSDRKKFHRALISAVIFEKGRPQAKKELGERTIERLTKDYGIMSRWDAIEDTIRKGNKKLMNMLFIYHAYTRYEEYLVMSEPSDPPASITKYIASTARAYPHLGYDPETFTILLNTNANLSEADEMKTARRYWSKSKPALHLLDGYYHNYLKHCHYDDQHIRHSILNPSWVEGAVKSSQLKLGRELLDIEMVKHGAPKHHKMNYDPTEAVFVDLLWDRFVDRGVGI